MSSRITPMTDPRPAKRGKRAGATDAALLFDEPGPRGRIMIAVGSVFAVLGIVATTPSGATSWDAPSSASSWRRPATLCP